MTKERLEKIMWSLIDHMAEHYYSEDFEKAVKEIFTEEEIKQLNLLEESEENDA